MDVLLWICRPNRLYKIKWQVFGKKVNPYLANKDRLNHMKDVVKATVYTSIAMSIFLMALAVMDEFNLHYFQALLMSIYFQVIAIFGIGTMLRSTQVKNMDFDVYKESI